MKHPRSAFSLGMLDECCVCEHAAVRHLEFALPQFREHM